MAKTKESLTFLTDFCIENRQDMKNKIVTDYNMLDYKNGLVKIYTETDTTFTDVLELMAFFYKKNVISTNEK